MRDKDAKAAYDRERYRQNADAIKARVTTWRAQNPDKALAYGRTWKARNPNTVKVYGKTRYKSRKEQQAAYTRWRKYGLTKEEYQRLYDLQEGRCAICSRIPEGPNATLHVDHNHTTLNIRALLCRSCNTGLGMLKDDPELLRTAADYIETFQ